MVKIKAKTLKKSDNLEVQTISRGAIPSFYERRPWRFYGTPNVSRSFVSLTITATPSINRNKQFDAGRLGFSDTAVNHFRHGVGKEVQILRNECRELDGRIIYLTGRYLDITRRLATLEHALQSVSVGLNNMRANFRYFGRRLRIASGRLSTLERREQQFADILDDLCHLNRTMNDGLLSLINEIQGLFQRLDNNRDQARDVNHEALGINGSLSEVIRRPDDSEVQRIFAVTSITQDHDEPYEEPESSQDFVHRPANFEQRFNPGHAPEVPFASLSRRRSQSQQSEQ
ncbi:MAG: hypothetical protein M1820_008241 [Bogoriella megaspora]|nr:MAG: hypothetical protein M1820_008241 [Bogoriella megaspora]